MTYIRQAEGMLCYLSFATRLETWLLLEYTVIWIYSAGIIQAVFLAASLLTLKLRNRTAAYALTSMILLLAIALAEQLADSSGAPNELALNLALELGLAPLLYIFVRSLADPLWRAKRQVAIHFIPMMVALFLLGVMHAANKSGNLGVAHPQFGTLIVVWVFLKMIYFSIYAVACEKTLRRAIAKAKSSRATSLKWIYNWLLLVFVAVAFSYLIFTLFLAGVEIWQDSDVYAGIAIFIIIFSIAYFVLANRKILDHTAAKLPLATGETVKNANLIAAHISSLRPYREPDFSIGHLVASMELSSYAVQAAITHLTGGSFHDYVNTLRLEEFDELARDTKNKSKTTLELAYAAGFNSKATFYRAFNSDKAMTPREFRESLKND